MAVENLTLVFLAILGLAIGFVGGLVGLVLGVLRFPLIFAETSVAIAAGTNIGVSTLGALTGAIRHFQQNNLHFRVFAIMAGTGAAGSFLGAFLTRLVSAQMLLTIIGLIVSYEVASLIKSSRNLPTVRRQGPALPWSLQ
ncbi:MAG: hypothetical protein DA330_05335 [Nitrososphaera sp.]|nr:hypothetical protein [Nitrososphaera sp.]